MLETAKLLATEIDFLAVGLLIQLVEFKTFGSDVCELLTVREFMLGLYVDFIIFEENSVFLINLIFITFKLGRWLILVHEGPLSLANTSVVIPAGNLSLKCVLHDFIMK